jgi:DNA-binding transcriptional LysR family regulator
MLGATGRITPASRPEAGADLDISLRHLFVFMAVAQAGSVAGAAEKLFRANSAIARTISALESVLPVRLFDRHAQGMLINGYGRIVLERAERIAQEFNAMSKGLDAKRPSAARAGAVRRAIACADRAGVFRRVLHERRANRLERLRARLLPDRGAGNGRELDARHRALRQYRGLGVWRRFAGVRLGIYRNPGDTGDPSSLRGDRDRIHSARKRRCNEGVRYPLTKAHALPQ